MARSSRVAARLPRQRAAVTNNPFRLSNNIDMRSQAGRRFADLAEAVIAEFGDASPEDVRSLATLRFTLERVQADFLAGDARLGRDITPLLRSIERREAALRLAKARESAKANPTLRDYLGAKS